MNDFSSPQNIRNESIDDPDSRVFSYNEQIGQEFHNNNNFDESNQSPSRLFTETEMDYVKSPARESTLISQEKLVDIDEF